MNAGPSMASAVDHDLDFRLVHDPDRAVFHTADGPVTGQQLLKAAHATAAALPDTPIVLLCSSVHGFTVLFLAAILRGHPVLLSSDRTPARFLTLARAHDATCVGFEDDQGTDQAVDGALILPRTDGAGAECADDPEIPADRLVAVVFTSGSTGAPVAHEKRWGALVARSIAARVLLDPETAPATAIGTVPPYHMYGFETLVLQALHTRGATAVGPAFYPADWQARLASAPAPRLLVTTPLQLRSLIRAGLVLPAIARVVSAAAPLDEALAREAEAALNAPVMEIYGATEIGSVALRRTIEGARWQLYDGVMLDATGETATIAAPGAPAYPLSDVVEADSAGGFRLIGRLSDMVKLGGKRASLAALNRALLAIPGVEDGAFLPPLEDGPGARMQVFASVKGVAAQEVLQGLRAVIEPAFLPRAVRIVDALPRNAVGKLTMQALRELAEASSERFIGDFVVAGDHAALPGHFPGLPVVPGVMLLDAAMTLAGVKPPARIDLVKFVRPVGPDMQVRFFLKDDGDKLRLTGRQDDAIVLRAVISR